MTDVLSEDDIPANLKEPCFFADNGDPSAYKDGNPIYREGYWGEKSAVRDAESGKNKTGKNNPVVDITRRYVHARVGHKVYHKYPVRLLHRLRAERPEPRHVPGR